MLGGESGGVWMSCDSDIASDAEGLTLAGDLGGDLRGGAEEAAEAGDGEEDGIVVRLLIGAGELFG